MKWKVAVDSSREREKRSETTGNDDYAFDTKYIFYVIGWKQTADRGHLEKYWNLMAKTIQKLYKSQFSLENSLVSENRDLRNHNPRSHYARQGVLQNYNFDMIDPIAEHKSRNQEIVESISNFITWTVFNFDARCKSSTIRRWLKSFRSLGPFSKISGPVFRGLDVNETRISSPFRILA